jgi:tRNA(fMet)-specific endonuclease VapC
MQYLLDTSTCVFFLRGKLHLDEIIKEKGLGNCFISEITVFELKYGAENSDDPKKSHRAVDKFVKGLTIIPIFGIVDQYANNKVLLRKNGER